MRCFGLVGRGKALRIIKQAASVSLKTLPSWKSSLPDAQASNAIERPGELRRL
jgi:hypothetical protein